MKKINFYFLFIVISVVWLSFFSYHFFKYRVEKKELDNIEQNINEIENKRYYERTVRALELEFENASRQSFTSKSSSEFIATLPKLGELSGLNQMKIESLGVNKTNNLEITSLKITSRSLFPEIANFIDLLERSKLPIQISSLKMRFKNTQLLSSMTLKIYKKNIED